MVAWRTDRSAPGAGKAANGSAAGTRCPGLARIVCQTSKAESGGAGKHLTKDRAAHLQQGKNLNA